MCGHLLSGQTLWVGHNGKRDKHSHDQPFHHSPTQIHPQFESSVFPWVCWIKCMMLRSLSRNGRQKNCSNCRSFVNIKLCTISFLSSSFLPMFFSSFCFLSYLPFFSSHLFSLLFFFDHFLNSILFYPSPPFPSLPFLSLHYLIFLLLNAFLLFYVHKPK